MNNTQKEQQGETTMNNLEELEEISKVYDHLITMTKSITARLNDIDQKISILSAKRERIEQKLLIMEVNQAREISNIYKYLNKIISLDK